MNVLEIPLPFIMSDWSPEVRELMRLVVKAHQDSAVNNQNVSSFAVVNGMAGSGDFSKACAGALLSIGGRHAPLDQVRHLITQNNPGYYEGDIIPGFGNSFFPDGDPAWELVEKYVMENFPDLYSFVDHWQTKVPSDVRPNAAMWTTLACEAAGIPEGYESLIFLLARAPAWAALCMKPNSPDESMP